MTKKGTLTVTVVEAKNLKDEDLIGKSDPYIKLILNENNTQATSTKSGDLNPTYNETFTFNIDGHKHLDIECWDKDTVTSDDIIGKNDVSLSHVISKGTDDVWVKLKSGKLGIRSKGEVHLQMTFEPIA
ncbi:hypothetical protein RhiirA5_365104 [Rhizophagus irregularis]|uniref:C2 domain-containing protein n=3 Tax=Rhizophagus irregularis TaxID=588596 RepID=A0A2I1EP49_9GLOM|nr:hypothetical protein GLOIN_2v1726827 [Rhizophagus irregularis DAOM 181602=DAOM 197198]EXX74105.1 Tcb1p [Rhizophagus irregularis DAOM 197198w]PKC01225.1 hypothetical protein RhiirA5_365104 [Rhizophagus irregularis]PKC72209.1 hypothetical protein RhiirA1_412084 [Rhizophagus irregularis]PKK70395.1 hypothetical protein RhiirC2_746551 [Rhizophagus irregularis]PKY23896.1 hypothetical protein RhiirB3_412443 [Rhizophagus irregularis]|eukprot:XP_025165752.1 hypothetical protein GLOIN_2v1726827 [Rhizophagus irregularis DAOM 181602=DAOM 197198]